MQSWDRRVRPRLVWSSGTLLASRVVHGMTGHLSSCMWNLRFWGTMHRGVSAPSFCAFIHRVTFEEVTGLEEFTEKYYPQMTILLRTHYFVTFSCFIF